MLSRFQPVIWLKNVSKSNKNAFTKTVFNNNNKKKDKLKRFNKKI